MDEFITLAEIGDGAYRAVPLIHQDEDYIYDCPATLNRWGDRRFKPYEHSLLTEH